MLWKRGLSQPEQDTLKTELPEPHFQLQAGLLQELPLQVLGNSVKSLSDILGSQSHVPKLNINSSPGLADNSGNLSTK